MTETLSHWYSRGAKLGTSNCPLRYVGDRGINEQEYLFMPKRSRGPAVRGTKGKRGNGAQKLKRKKKK